MSRASQWKSIQRASNQSSTVHGSICCISLCVEGGWCPSDLSPLVGSADIGASASSIMGCGTYIVFHGLLGLAYDQQDPDTCLWRHTSYSGPESNSHPSCSHPSIQCCSLVLCRPFLSRLTHQFLPYPQLLSLWFLTSLSPVLHLVSISPSFLPKLTAQPCFLLAFCLALSPFPFLSPYSPYPPSPEGVD